VYQQNQDIQEILSAVVLPNLVDSWDISVDGDDNVFEIGEIITLKGAFVCVLTERFLKILLCSSTHLSAL